MITADEVMSSEHNYRLCMQSILNTLLAQSMCDFNVTALDPALKMEDIMSDDSRLAHRTMKAANPKWHALACDICKRNRDRVRAPMQFNVDNEFILAWHGVEFLLSLIDAQVIFTSPAQMGAPPTDWTEYNPSDRQRLHKLWVGHLGFVSLACVRAILKCWDGDRPVAASVAVKPKPEVTMSQFKEMDQRAVAESLEPGTGYADLMPYVGRN